MGLKELHQQAVYTPINQPLPKLHCVGQLLKYVCISSSSSSKECTRRINELQEKLTCEFFEQVSVVLGGRSLLLAKRRGKVKLNVLRKRLHQDRQWVSPCHQLVLEVFISQ